MKFIRGYIVGALTVPLVLIYLFREMLIDHFVIPLVDTFILERRQKQREQKYGDNRGVVRYKRYEPPQRPQTETPKESKDAG